MDSFLHNRQQFGRSGPAQPARKAAAKKTASPSGLPAHEADEPAEVVPAPVDLEAPDAPKVRLEMRAGTVHKILIDMPDGKRLELLCEYGDGDADEDTDDED